MTDTEGPPAEAVQSAVGSSQIELFSLGGLDGILCEVNEPFARLLDRSVEELNGRSLLELVHPEDIERIVAGLAALDRGEPEVLIENRFVQPDHTWVHLQWVAHPLPGSDRWWARGRDTSEFHRLLAERLALRARLDLAIGAVTAAMWDLDVAAARLTWELQAADVLGMAGASLPSTVEELAGAVQAEDAEPLRAAFVQLLDTGAATVELRIGGDLDRRFVSLRGKVLDRDRRGRPLRAVGLVLDITNEKAMEEQLLRMVMSDPLTGVPNRRSFDQTLRNEWRRAKRDLTPFSVIMVDIDNFKRFNDTFGHLVGDEALSSVARALSVVLHRGGDVLARFGGEEFAVILPNTDCAGALHVADRLVEAARAVVVRQANGTALSVSVGTATWHPDDAPIKAVDLVGRADEALYVAKTAGKDRAVSYEASVAVRADLEAAIAAGLANGEFELYYQPVIALASGEVSGFEALMRWNRPGHGLVPPDSFIPVAEGSDLICDLGRWALEQAAGQLAAWSRDGTDPSGGLTVAVNASGRHVASPAIVDDVAAALVAAGIAGGRLEVELTETMIVENALAAAHLGALRERGVRVAIDDFGTGFASVGQLSQLPVDILKIDRTFVTSADPRQRGLVRLMVDAAHSFDLRAVAEGVEDGATFDMLRELGCDAAQGYFMARPMPAAQVGPWLAQWQPTGVDRAAISG